MPHSPLRDETRAKNGPTGWHVWSWKAFADIKVESSGYQLGWWAVTANSRWADRTFNKSLFPCPDVSGCTYDPAPPQPLSVCRPPAIFSKSPPVLYFFFQNVEQCHLISVHGGQAEILALKSIALLTLWKLSVVTVPPTRRYAPWRISIECVHRDHNFSIRESGSDKS